MSSLDAQVQGRLRTLLDQYLNALKDGVDGLASFLMAFTDFDETLQLQRCHLKPETLDMIPHFVNTINAITSSIIDLEVDSDTICSNFDKDISSILTTEVGRLTIRDESQTEQTDSSVTSAPYIRLACQWLLANLHKPYPTKEVITSISQQAGSSSRNINAWFVDARRRIGWNDLRNRRFGKKKDAIVKAATLFFKPDAEVQRREGGQPPEATLAHEDYLSFQAVHVSAMSLFAELTPTTGISHSFKSPLPTTPFRHPPSTSAQRKRARSCDLTDAEHVDLAPNKRIRLNRSFSAPYEISPIKPVSIIPSTQEQPLVSRPLLGRISDPPETPPSSSAKRKRSGSDDTENPSKRSCLNPDMPAATQLTTPSSCSGDSFASFDWSVLDELDFSLELPSPVSTASLGENPVEISCYQFDATVCGSDGRLSPLFSGLDFDFNESHLPNFTISPTSSLASLETSAASDHPSPASETVATPESFTRGQLPDDENLYFCRNFSDVVPYSGVFDLSFGDDGFIRPSTEPVLPLECQINNIGLYDKITKYKRAQMLRAELQRLEAEVL